MQHDLTFRKENNIQPFDPTLGVKGVSVGNIYATILLHVNLLTLSCLSSDTGQSWFKVRIYEI